MTSSEIIYTALLWAEESMLEMVIGCGKGSSYGAEVAARMKQLRAYRLRRFGVRPTEGEGSRLVSISRLLSTVDD